MILEVSEESGQNINTHPSNTNQEDIFTNE